MNTRPAADRFYEKVSPCQETGCWNWTGSLVNGYGQFGMWPKVVRAHRFAYELLIGPIPAGLCIDHLCRNRRCVNPAHLEPVTWRENLRRGSPIWARSFKTNACPHGHSLADAMTPPSGGRKCRECDRQKARRRYWVLKSNGRPCNGHTRRKAAQRRREELGA